LLLFREGLLQHCGSAGQYAAEWHGWPHRVQGALASGAVEPWRPSDEGRHEGAAVEEWTFSFWTTDGSVGGIVLLRLIPAERAAWYWSALARAGEALLHVADWDVRAPKTGLAIRSHGLWADHICEAPFEQWTIANEAYAVALDDPEDALDRAYGSAAPLALDLEWYASAPASASDRGYAQPGEVHGVAELASGRLALDRASARRTHRWGDVLGPVATEPAVAHLGPRAPVAFPDGSVLDLVLTPDGWRRRMPR
jgi:hypothetical protein